MNGRRLLVLMWKHLRVRMRRYFHSPIELVSPVIFIVIVFCFKDDIKSSRPSSTRIQEPLSPGLRNTEALPLSNLMSELMRILYTPETNFTNDLMEAVGTQFNMNRSPVYQALEDRKKNKKAYYGFTNSSEISEFVTDMYHYDEAIVIFDVLEEDTMPVKLSYTIRQKKSFDTDDIMPSDGRRPHSGFGEVYHEFMALQWAIDTSFIELRTGEVVDKNISYLREFPSIGRTNDDTMKLLSEIVYVCCFLSLFLVFVFLMARLLEERSTGIQELIKMVGVSTNLFGLSHFLNVAPAGLMYCVVNTILLKVTSHPLIDSNGFLIFLTLLLHFISIISMAFACSYLTKNTQYAVSLSVFSYVILWLPLMLTNNYPVRGVAVLTGLLPHVPLMWFWREIAAVEQYGEELTFSNILESHSTGSAPVALGFVFMILQALLFFTLAWYLSHVRPGNYGQAQPWNFLCQRQYWSKNEVKPESEMDEEFPITMEPQYFENPPSNLEPGIKIENVSKVYPKHKALSNVTLDVYKGEITVLLGHNGAGKTTLMSIITGMISSSEGRILVNGMDIKTKGDDVRQHLGLCPQHNLFFPDLTVVEHVTFFTLLKGGSYKEAHNKSLALLDKLGLQQKADESCSSLSGGMKRRLQLACALAGDASVLILDEPTSGLDVETRRDLWDLLLSLRGDRTVLLTTHFMEEADALGDRVAALHLGRLRCHATTMHLKKAIGTGYRLTFTTNGLPRDAAVTAAVIARVPEATLKEKTINSLSYNLPATASKKFPRLFASLEDKKSELGIETIGVGVSTLEEVFLKLCSDTDNSYSEDEVDTTRTEPTYNKVNGPILYFRQCLVLFKRQFKYIMYKKIAFLILQVVIPILMIFGFTRTFNSDQTEIDSTRKLALNMELYTPMLARKVLFDAHMHDDSIRSLNDQYPKVDFIKAANVTDAVLRASETDVTDYNNYVAGLEITDTTATAFYTTTVRHAAPVALNLLTNVLAMRYLGQADGRTFNAYVHPIRATEAVFDEALVQPKPLELGFMYCVLIVFVFLSTNINSVSLPCKERTTGSRHIHIMSGCPAILHWAVTCIFHTFICVVFLVTAIAISAATLDTDHTISRPDFIISFVVILILSALAFFALMYIASMYFEERSASIVIIAVLLIFGLITTTIKTVKNITVTDDQITFTNVLLSIASYTMPPHAAIMAAGKAMYVARINAYCDLNKNRCPYLYFPENESFKDKCCVGEKPLCTMCISEYAPGKEMITLACQFLIYMTLLIFIQHGVFNCLYDRIFNGKYRNSSPKVQNNDEIVRAEAVYVNKQIALPKKKIIESNHAMLVSDLHKNYFRVFGKSCNAVRGVNFSVKRGECFGLLGVNGAGKSTTFKMLTAEECPTKGQIYANGFFIKESQPYLRSLGYCPQFFGLDDFQTGRENLTLLLTLRGLDAVDVAQEVKSWINIVGLEKYSSRVVAGYSGGCTRRLAAAAALASGAPVTLLDEPTAGVDVAARRRVWSALKKGLRQGRSVIITSHSMDEMEALCSRIAILSGGVVRAVGTPSELRAHHAAGHAVVIKVSPLAHGDEVDSPKSDLDRLKSSLQHMFNCTLKDEHKTMLHYHINETMRYSSLFKALEELKAAHPALVEDYSVTETTLEEVFLSIAKEQKEGTPAPTQTDNHIV